MKGLKKCCKVCTNSNVGQTLEISVERYKQLIDAEITMKVLKDVLLADDGLHSYTTITSKTIDNLMGIDRSKKYEK